MVRKLLGIILALMLSAGIASAQEKREAQESGLSSWLRSMRHKLDLVNPRKTLPVTTGVAGVRGAKQDAEAKLYWKGKRDEGQVSEAELAELKEAISLAEAGKNEEAIKELEEFMRQYPDSTLIPDAKRTLDLAKAAPKEEPKPTAPVDEAQQAAPAADAAALPQAAPQQH